VATGRILPERIPDYAALDTFSIGTPDGSGFFYNQLTGKVALPSATWIRAPATTGSGRILANDPIVMARGLDPAVAFEKIAVTGDPDIRDNRSMPVWCWQMCARSSEC